ncbi:hypothetical protein [Salibacterium qingdaonense]|uniref:ABC-2 type transport system permease protein n=1 Tax=Salibacterium qingdaonense TaxID=266892 RepID=A0A1I4MDK3_9BACI|nr:hypothetical protein [Salibacterium qingdaonense]SFM01311.1 ABC-2 type transport system permease protein [Salibacterium qingdaonense]
MTSKVSFFNPGIQKQNFKQFGWIGIVILIGWIFIVPMRMIRITDDWYGPEDVTTMTQISNGTELPVIVGGSILTGMFLFRYLQVPDAADMMHSLPVRRESLFFNQVLTGLVLIMAPLLITAGAAQVIAGMYPEFNELTPQTIWSWAGAFLIMSVFFFLFTVFVGMAVGMSIATGIITMILLILPAGMYTLINGTIAFYLYGAPSSNISAMEAIVPFSPLLFVSNIVENQQTAWQLAGYAAAAVLFGAAALVLYKLRPIETASEAITFRVLRPIFKYGVTFCAMLTFSVFYSQNDNTGWIIFGYVFGSAAGYFIAEMILKKTWRVFRGRALIGYGGYAVVIIIAGAMLHYDVFGYESTIPDSDSVQSVYVGEFISHPADYQNLYSTSDAYLDDVQQLHQAIIDHRPEEEQGASKQSVSIAYELENGKTIIRQYFYIDTDGFSEKLQDVKEYDAYNAIP